MALCAYTLVHYSYPAAQIHMVVKEFKIVKFSVVVVVETGHRKTQKLIKL